MWNCRIRRDAPADRRSPAPAGGTAWDHVANAEGLITAIWPSACGERLPAGPSAPRQARRSGLLRQAKGSVCAGSIVGGWQEASALPLPIRVAVT